MAITTRAIKSALRSHALTFEGAHEDHPWGENVTKAPNNKVFAFFGMDDGASDWVVGVKLTRSLLYARSLPFVEAMGYGLGKSGWCSVKKPARGGVDVALMKDWIAESFEAIATRRARPAPKARPPAPRGRARVSRAASRRSVPRARGA